MRIVETKTPLSTPRSDRSDYWSVHTHSRFSNNDALPKVEDLVALAAHLGQPALAVTDHGNMAASVKLYQACAKVGIAAFPGTELYMVPSIEQHRSDYANKQVKATRFHLGVVAYTSQGYENLVGLNTTAHRQHFHKPLVDFASLADLSDRGKLEGLCVTTGCYFGYLAQLQVTRGREAAEQWVKTLASWFPKVYVEMQNHNITHDEEWDDDELADALVELADRVGLPMVVAQDSHYLHPGDRTAHETLKRLVAWGDQPDDAVFPGDGFHLADADWMADHHHPRRLERGCEGLRDLLKSHAVSIPVLDRYSYAVPQLTDNPQEELESRVGVTARKRDRWTARYAQRLDAELEVVGTSGMAGYLLLVAEVCDWMRDNDILFQTRGSAAGSAVCWLLGITNVDPVKWDLRFERFLSKDRTKPPDIDLDIEHERREEVIAWLRTRFAVHQISTWARYSLEGEEESSTGSLRVRYFSTANKMGKDISNWGEVPAEDKRRLHDLVDRELYMGLGKNAAGIVVTAREQDFAKLVPLHHMASGEPVAQYDKDDVETLGLVKLDVLGSKTLTVLKRCELLVHERDPGFSLMDIDLRDGQTFALMRSGKTDGVFQLEGGSTKRGLRELKPTTVRHVIAAMALFRPAVMKTGATDSYIARKNDPDAKVPAMHPLLEAVTKKTYGVMLYQEDVVDLVRSLGMEVEELSRFLKAVKASNKDIGGAGQVVTEMLGWIRSRCREEGMSYAEVDWVLGSVRGFAEYSFNRAHATVYGLTAYRCAYLAVHHALEFHCALLSVAAGDGAKDKRGLTKEQRYTSAARSRRVKVKPPAVNVSGATYVVDRRAGVIRRGYRSVRGVGEVAAGELADKQPFSDLVDLCQRVEPRKVTGAKAFLATGEVADINGTILRLIEQDVLDDILDEGVRETMR